MATFHRFLLCGFQQWIMETNPYCFCPHAGILHKGDGTNVYLKERPRRVAYVLGDGQPRPVDCRGCDGQAKYARLLAPVALAAGRDGSSTSATSTLSENYPRRATKLPEYSS